MFFDPVYMVILGVSALLSFGAQLWVKKTVGKWQHVPLSRGMTGRDIAQAILDAEGIKDVHIEPVDGILTDHYDPRNKVLRLSLANYQGRTVAAAGIAAHEVGHAVQHAQGYAPMKFRQALVPIAGAGTNIGVWMIVIGAAIGFLGLAQIGVALFGGFVLFTLVTLPVEFDASSRAKKALEKGGIVTGEEAEGVARVLRAAAGTYVAAAVSAIMQLLYFLLRSGMLRGRGA